MRVLWSTAQWASAIGEVPVEGWLPVRTVLVPRERVAHALRRELVRAGRQELLIGTRFVSPVSAAMEVLRAVGVQFDAGEEELRPARLRRLFVECPALSYFEPADLRAQRGWDEALASTITDLEGAGFCPEDLPADGAAADVATLWRAVEERAGGCWTRERIVGEAAARLEADPDAWPLDGAVLAAVTGHESAALARFVRAIPNAERALLGARPGRAAYLDRVHALYGDAARTALASATPPRADATERDRLASHLFEPPAAITGGHRARRNGADGTVHLEQYAGVEEELEAAAEWVGREVLEHGTALEDVAVLVPNLDPLGAMLVDRLRRLPWPGEGEAMPVFVAGGLPLASDAAGARVLAVVRALRTYLGADALADVLPALQTEPDPEDGDDEQGRRLSRGDAMRLAWSLGTVGGSAANPTGALAWVDRAERRLKTLEREIARAGELGDEQPRIARGVRHLERMHRNLQAALPAIGALQAVASRVVEQAPLRDLWPPLRDVLADHVRLPGPGARIPKLLDRAMRPLADAPDCGELAGDEALRLVEETLLSLREPCGRFGEPAVYLGTLEGATGLAFAATRVIGLCEGALPSVPREDPVLPDELRGRLARHALRTTNHRVVEQLHALDRVVRDTRERVVLSAPKLEVQRAQREPSSVFIEAAAAVGRPDERAEPHAEAKPAEPHIPDMGAVERTYFVPARAQRRAFRRRMPLTESAWHDRVAAAARPPSWWHAAEQTNIERTRAILTAQSPQPDDGLLGDALPAEMLPGLTPERATSPSRLGTLLECPHRYLFEHVLGLSEPASAPTQRQLDSLTYGSLIHTAAERFSHKHGEAFGRREQTLAHWKAEAERIADACFGELLETYPLAGELPREQERRQLRRDLSRLLEHDWDDGRKRRYVAAELGFGWDDGPLALAVDGGSLYVRGFIDRVDVQGERTLIRDIKSGKVRPRRGVEAVPHPGIDLQIGLYALAARELAQQWDIPREMSASYVHPVTPAEPERAFEDDFDELAQATHKWLGIGRRLLEARALPRTPVEADCKYCTFEAVCGPNAQARAKRVLRSDGAPGALTRFGALKVGEDEL